MIEAIIHQVFWTSVSFVLFFLLMRKAIINITIAAEKRQDMLNKLEEQIKIMNAKADNLKKMTNAILLEEIPSNERFYIEKKLEPILQEIEQKLFDEHECLRKKLTKKEIKLDAVFQELEDIEKYLKDNSVKLISKVGGSNV